PQTAINDMLIEFDHDLLGPLTLVASPVHLSDAPVLLRHKPPRLGEHTAEVIAAFGLDAKVRAAG
ncbi:MAG: CoA transferase, partial [Martelella sp.]